QIATPGNRLDDRTVVIAKLLSQFANALHERVIGHSHVGPNGIVKLLLGEETPRILGEIAQELERLRPQLKVASRNARAAAHQVQLEPVEAQDSGNDLVHGAPPHDL